MQHINTFFAACAIAVTALASAPAVSQTTDAMTRGEVRKVDKDAGKITIKHEEIKSLDMPPMTMVLVLKDAAMLEKLKPGDQVIFAVSREDGKFVITDIQTSK